MSSRALRSLPPAAAAATACLLSCANRVTNRGLPHSVCACQGSLQSAKMAGKKRAAVGGPAVEEEEAFVRGGGTGMAPVEKKRMELVGGF